MCLLCHRTSCISDSSIFAQTRASVRVFAHLTAKRSFLSRKRRIYTHIHAIPRTQIRTNANRSLLRDRGLCLELKRQDDPLRLRSWRAAALRTVPNCRQKRNVPNCRQKKNVPRRRHFKSTHLSLSPMSGSNQRPFAREAGRGLPRFYSWTLVRAARHARHRKPPAQRVEANFRYATKTFPLA